MITQGDGQGRDKDRTASRQQESISEEDDDEGEEAIVIELAVLQQLQGCWQFVPLPHHLM